jgi:uncharacterized membrane protein YdjX (TVP38/TMEM64 family)
MTPKRNRPIRYRLLLVILIFVGLYVLSRSFGLTDWNAESIHKQIEDAGLWGFLLYIAIFSGGEFIHIPGMVFVGAGLLAYGAPLGWALAYIASVVSVCVSFLLVRAIGGRALSQVDHPFAKKILLRLDEHPIRAVFVLRLFLWLAPALNYSLALSNIHFRDYLIGSALGLVLPILGASLFFGWVL